MSTSTVGERENARPLADMYGMAGMPELMPPLGPLRPSPEVQYNPGHVMGNMQNFGAAAQRLGQRAPKLGQIGRSKKVVIEDEDLDDMMNNNGQFPTGLAPVS